MPLAPLVLPAPDEYLDWLAHRVESSLEQARGLAQLLRSGVSGAEALGAWNDVNIAVSNVVHVSELMANVHGDPDVRARAERGEQDAKALLTELGLDRELYDVLAAVDPSGLDELSRRFLARSLRDFHRAGVDRDDETRDRMRELSSRMTELSQLSQRHIRDGGRSIQVTPDELAGLPDDYREAHPPGEDGLVTIGTDYPDYVPFMSFGTDRGARRRLAVAYLNRGWPQNDAVFHELLSLRREQAQLLGYRDWPSYDAEIKMIGDGPRIIEFVDRITQIAEERGRRDFQAVLSRLRQDVPDAAHVDAADKLFYTEVIRREEHDVDAQTVRAYFEFAKVRSGLLDVTGRLFGIEYVDVPDAPVWHEDVSVHDVYAEGEQLGRIYLDLHPRPAKYSHAAQFTLTAGVAHRQLPEGVLVCNLPRGLMEHDDVVTLFHEFGHVLHHILGGHHPWIRFSGVSTEWDFVEAPSQMLEQWAWDAEVLQSFATDAHGQPIPTELVKRMRDANAFGKGSAVRAQMFYAAVAYFLHAEVPDDITSAVDDIQRRYDLFTPLPGNHLAAGFGHLDGYSSGYYTYMWSLVIAKDLFSAFEHDDLFAPEVARRYRDAVLVPGGTKDAADLVADFLGRPYSFDAFEEWLGE
ncbi:MAG TPA: M3 family metallopeptidase [Nocardioidaceae bacterium]|nr:M3 family metallopeptidase [Nocardioidaceae bacterium]